MQISRPVLRYYGGKYRLADWIISFFPPHEHYCEPCGGAASVLLNKPRSKIETYNDLDQEIVNFFQVLREDAEELIRLLYLTPWSRVEFELSLEPAKDKIERARRFFVQKWLSINGSANNTAGRVSMRKVFKHHFTTMPTDHLMQVANRLLGVQIECKPYDYIINKYDTPQTLFYLDPPYLPSTRSHKNEYAHEWSESEHIKCAEILNNISGMAILSGYDSELYNNLYANWQKRDKITSDMSGKSVIDCLWLSPNIPEDKQLFLW